MRRALLGAALVIASQRPVPAAAQDVEVPLLVIEEEDGTNGTLADDELDLANLVTGAAKSVTTVQEAPAIITIIPAEELRDRQSRNLMDVIDLIPGMLRFDMFNGLFPQAVSRGVVQAVLNLRDGFSMFDPTVNAMTLHRGVPLETIKRIEVISGPGGVLWGANSFLGVVNVITKDAEDIDGVEASVGFGDGQGDRDAYRGYVMAGAPRLFGKEDWGLVMHASFESYKGPAYSRPAHMFSTPLPNPNSLFFYGAERESNQDRSSIFNFDGKLTLGGLTLHWFILWMERYMALGFNGPLSLGGLAEDDLPECTPVGSSDPGADLPSSGSGMPEPGVSDRCVDRARASRQIKVNFYERYALVDYKTRLSPGAGLNVKGYFIQFVRQFDPLVVLMPVPGLLEGGLAFSADFSAYRAGASLDGDVELTDGLRLLYGWEAFHEWLPDNTTRSRQGAGIQADFLSPYNLGRLPFACPRDGAWDPVSRTPRMVEFVDGCPITFIFQASRTTLGGFTSAQYRASSRLVFDAGVRLQAAPELGSTALGYGLQPTLGAAAVWEIVPDWHLKLNYTEGFRPPVFNNTASNGDAVSVDGSPDLLVETSRSTQTEINARLLKRKKRIRELNLRLDYSYTELDDFIAFIGGRYANVGKRGIQSAEMLLKLYLVGGHRFEVGYTFNQIVMADKGAFHSMPNHWLNVSSVNTLVERRLELATVLRVYGAFEDPNRRVEARGLAPDPLTGASNPEDSTQTVTVHAYEVVFDRQPPAAEVQVGLRWTPAYGLELQGTLYNAFASERPAYDNADDLEPRLEIVPSQFESFRFLLSAAYTF